MAETKEKYLDYRGDIKALVGMGPSVSFTTVHPEGLPTGVYTLDLEKGAFTTMPLPCGGSAMLSNSKGLLYIAGSDTHLYMAKPGDKAPKPVGKPLSTAAIALALLGGNQMAALLGPSIVIIDRLHGTEVQTLVLDEAVGTGCVMASDESGKWLAVGTNTGHLAIFEWDEQKGVTPCEHAQLHTGPVSALMFDPVESRVLSMGTDNKLLSTHVRGALEPEDKGGRAVHEKTGRAFVCGKERFYTSGEDGQIKAWPHGASKARPSSFKDGVGRTTAMALVTVNKRPHLVTASETNTLRVFLLDTSGKVSHKVEQIFDGYALAKRELDQQDTKRRLSALKQLAAYNDLPAIKILAVRAAGDSDPKLRVTACDLIGTLDNPKIESPLKELLKKKGTDLGEVRLSALKGLQQAMSETPLSPLILALETGQADVGEAAVNGLATLAKTDDQAMVRLTQALEDNPKSVRMAALEALEKLHDKSPTPNLTAAQSSHADLRYWTQVRLVQREMLKGADVKGAVRRLMVDKDGQVRQTAFLLSLLMSPKLADHLRALDKELHRRLFQLSTFGKDKKLPKAPKAPKLSPVDLEPLLEAMASRSLDICISGALYLAMLQDPRALGTLLQLSADKKADSRVSAAKALALLGDQRATKRLGSMLHDNNEQVRDAAYTALDTLNSKTPLTAVEAAMFTKHDDVRLRGLNTLVSSLKKKKPKKEDDPGVILLRRCLSDSAQKVRAEAFKSTLSLQVGADEQRTLKFILSSMHADIRKEVLTELMANIKKAWAFELSCELIDDPDSALRKEAFDFVCKQIKKQYKSSETSFFESALSARFDDIRTETVRYLSKQKYKGVMVLLQKALSDNTPTVRLTAIDAIERANDTSGLKAAVNSPHKDVSIRAAATLAALGDHDAAAPLLTQIQEEKPQVSDLEKLWKKQVIMALAGLAALELDSVTPQIRALIESTDADIRRAAAAAVIWTIPHSELESLYDLLRHNDNTVKHTIAMGLAYRGDPAGASLIFADRNRALNSFECLVAAMMLNESELFNAFLDAPDDGIRQKAFWLMMIREWQLGTDGEPNIAGLSSTDPRMRLRFAEALESIDNLGPFIVEQMNHRGDHVKPWALSLETIEELASRICRGSMRHRVRAALTLKQFDEDKAHGFNHAFKRLTKRYDAPEKTDTVPVSIDKSTLSALVVGAYTGLSREQGGHSAAKVRLTALTRLKNIVEDFSQIAPIFIQALGDGHAPVRAKAFEVLTENHSDPKYIAEAALATGLEDMGRAGLALLAQSGDGEQLLKTVMLTHTDGLETTAQELLMERTDAVSTAQAALEGTSKAVRTQATHTLSDHYDESKPAKNALHKALTSRFEDIRESSALILANKKDKKAFEPLISQLVTTDVMKVRLIVKGLMTLNAPKTADALLDRIEADPSASSDIISILFNAVGSCRNVKDVERLSRCLTLRRLRKPALSALRKISGYDQYFGFNEEDETDTEWLEGLHPHHHDVLAKLLKWSFELGETGELKELLKFATWTDDSVIDAPLGPLTDHSDNTIRYMAIGVVSFRLRKRNGPHEPLLAVLNHKDPGTQFAAAEGLALAGRGDGISILLSAMDMLDDVDLRSRAVTALGKLGDERALDKLLKLAGENEHALQEPAAEAIGHLAHTAKADEIFKLLKQLSTSTTGIAQEALKGLRYFNTSEAWQLIRDRYKDDDWQIRETVAELLRHHDDPVELELLAKMITEDDDYDVVYTAAKSARRRHGADSLEPDYLFIQSAQDDIEPDTIKRLSEKGDASRLLKLLPKIHEECEEVYLEPLVDALLNRSPLPLTEAASALRSKHTRTVQVAARIIARGTASDAKSHHKAVSAALSEAVLDWQTLRNDIIATGAPLPPPPDTNQYCRVVRRHTERDSAETATRLAEIASRLKALLITCGQIGYIGKEVNSALELEGPDGYLTVPRTAALSVLANGKGDKGTLQTLSEYATNERAELREIAAAGLARLAPNKASDVLARTLDDRNVVNRLAENKTDKAIQEALRSGASKVHVQGIVLPQLIKRGDVDGLAAVIKQKSADEATLLGAIEALGKLGTKEAMNHVVEAAKDKSHDELLRKAAWRTLRRTKRRQVKAQEGSMEVSK